ncbi:hypothetical protein PoB_004193800 [Plakobranchus ocellatus]|uniref:Uncharacterized protein n=1 Tax=Plakobranchus ocellatus TaxID=259542 RepID=A0AAV4B9E2_9GAST|nr:hypothetical protein PoB_004193800 [Plakobranchus ocellatus]
MRHGRFFDKSSDCILRQGPSGLNLIKSGHIKRKWWPVDSEAALRSVEIFLSWARARPKTPWPDGGAESLRSPCCGLALQKTKFPFGI